MVKAASSTSHVGPRLSARALLPWSSLVNSCCILILEHGDHELDMRDNSGRLRRRGVLQLSPEVKLAFKELLLALASSAVELEANPAKAV